MDQRTQFPERLSADVVVITAEFRAHQATILELATLYCVRQETMRQFLKAHMPDYRDVVIERREQLHLSLYNPKGGLSRQHQQRHSILWAKVECSNGDAVRTTKDFTPDELKEMARKIGQRTANDKVGYHHPYVVNPHMGDVD